MTDLDPHAGQPVVSLGLPLADARAAAILIHGRNAGPRNILDLVPRLDCAGFTYLAPTAANRTWYPLSFLAERGKNEPFLTSAIRRLDALVTDVVAAGISRDRIVIMGFSQGACLAAEFLYRHPARYGGVVGFSGGLIGPPGTTWSTARSLDGTPVFLGCSDVDAHVPKARVDETTQVFALMGASVTERIYPGMGHLVAEDEIEHARALMKGVAP